MAAQQLPPLPVPARSWDRIAVELRLSPTQKRIVEQILQQQCDKQISAALELKPPTLKTHLGRIYARAKVADRLELVLVICRMSHQL